jgi:hypothetical protein
VVDMRDDGKVAEECGVHRGGYQQPVASRQLRPKRNRQQEPTLQKLRAKP